MIISPSSTQSHEEPWHKPHRTPCHSVNKMNSAAVSNNGPTRVSLFPFPPRYDTASDVCKYPCARFGRGKEYLGSALRTGWLCL